MYAYLTLDVDPDFTGKSRAWEKAKEGIHRCLGLFKEFSLQESITWFVNNAELEFTSRRSNHLSKLCDGEIALHLHLDRPEWSGNYYCLPEREEDIYAAIKKEKEKLESWTTENLGREVICFRSGDLLTSEKLFAALNRLGIKIDSSMPSQFDWSLKEIGRRILCQMPPSVKLAVSRILVNKHAYPTLPLGVGPFMIGRVLEMPIHIYAGGDNLKKGIKWLKKRTAEQVKRGVRELVIYWHPHEILGKEKIFSDYIEYLFERGFNFRKMGDYLGNSHTRKSK